MEWYEITVRAAQQDLETVQNTALFLSAAGLYTEDYSDLEQECERITGMRLIDEDLLAKDRSVGTVHIYLEPQTHITEWLQDFRQRLDSAGVRCELSQGTVAEKDWNAEWRKYYKPTRVGEHLVIVPCWENYETRPDDLMIRLDPGLAFGTGTHESTQLCLGLLERYTQPDCRMMDVGTGSGILAIAALLLGAKEACGCDIDPIAVKMSGVNAALNGVEDRLRVRAGELDDSFGGAFDLMTANIVADVIIALLPEIHALLRPEGTLIVSGIIAGREADVLSAAQKNRMTVLRREAKNNWVALALRRG